MTTLDKDEKKLLNLIDSRYTASQMADAIFDKVSVQIEASKGGQVVNLKRNGSSMAFDGFLSVYGEKQDDLILPNLTIGQVLSLSGASGSQHFTRPPARHSDASIVKILERDGVGRPSTYASILDTLFERDYIVRNGNTLHATEVGMMVSEYLSKNFPKIVDPQFTSKMEGDLDKIAEGAGDYKEILSEFCDNLECQVSDALKGSIPESFMVDTCCSKCASKMIKRISKNGPYLGCSSWPICDGVRDMDGAEAKDRVVETGHKCPDA
jgi:DNA topoisomerase-1